MRRTELPLSQAHLRPVDLEMLVHEAATLKQRTLETYPRPFPKAPERWLSHDRFRPRPSAYTAPGEVEGGLSGLLGATIDLSFTRALLAPDDSKEGGHCDDPASSLFLAVARRLDRYPDEACVCGDLRQQDKGQRDRELAGLHEALPGEDALSPCRRRVGAEAIEAALAVFVGLFWDVGLITGELLATDGQLAPSSSRFKGWASFGPACRQLPWDEADRPARCRQLQAGATRRERRCPCPEVVHTVRQATATQGKPREPTVALLGIAPLPADRATSAGPQALSDLLALPPAQLPPLRITWSHLTQGPQGARWGRCPKVPSDRAARVGDHIDQKDPHPKERVFGSLQQQTTNSAIALGVALPVGSATYPANAAEGRHFPAHRAKVALPFRPRQVERADAGDAVVENYQDIRGRGGIPSLAYNPRREDLSPEALVARGDDTHGTPDAPWGRRCRANGYDSQAASRPYGWGRPCPLPARARCPHGQTVRGSTHNMSCHAYPRWIGPLQRGTEPWKIFDAARTASARTPSDDQEGSDHGRPLKLRGLQAFRVAGAIRPLAHVLRRALTLIREVTYTLGKLRPAPT